MSKIFMSVKILPGGHRRRLAPSKWSLGSFWRTSGRHLLLFLLGNVGHNTGGGSFPAPLGRSLLLQGHRL
jgi:hypothetical protein